MLEEVSKDATFDCGQRNVASGLIDSYQTKQFIAMAYLFTEVFSITGPLSRSLQSVKIDFGKVLDLLELAIIQLATLREELQKVIEFLN